MKKLIMTVAVVAMAAITQAASIDWGVNAFPMFKGADGSTALAAGSSAYLIVDWSSNQSAIIAALSEGTLSTDTAGVIAQSATSNTMGFVPASTATSDKLTYDVGTTTYDFAVLLIDTNTKSGETWYNVSQANTKAAYDSTKLDEFEKTEAVFAAQNAFTAANSQTGGWQQAAVVPEPTTGLLLLIGMAGLALRRKQK